VPVAQYGYAVGTVLVPVATCPDLSSNDRLSDRFQVQVPLRGVFGYVGGPMGRVFMPVTKIAQVEAGQVCRAVVTLPGNGRK
jgi:hypothetical protein